MELLKRYMVKRYILGITTILSFLLLVGCKSNVSAPPSASTDWAYNFVVWNGDIYHVLDHDYVDEKDIEEEIGEVTKYSDQEGTYGDGFSNKFPVGTKLFSIKYVDSKEYIAILNDGSYIRAEYKGKYGERANEQINEDVSQVSFFITEVEQLRTRIDQLENNQNYLQESIQQARTSIEQIERLYRLSQSIIKEVIDQACLDQTKVTNARIEIKRVETDHLNLSYPEVQGLSCSLTQNIINQLIEGKVFEVIANTFALDDIDTYSYEVEANVTYNDKGLLSIVFYYQISSPHWAHPGKETSALTFNLSNGSFFSLQDFFIQPLDFIRYVNEQIYETLDDSHKELFHGITEYQDYYLTEEHLVVLYKLGGNALPYLEIELERSKMKDLSSLN